MKEKNKIQKSIDSLESEIHPVETTEEKTMIKEERHILSDSETNN